MIGTSSKADYTTNQFAETSTNAAQTTSEAIPTSTRPDETTSDMIASTVNLIGTTSKLLPAGTSPLETTVMPGQTTMALTLSATSAGRPQ